MRSEYVKPEEWTAIMHHMGYENALAVRTSIETGLRIGDVLKMTPQDLDGVKITYQAQKTGKRGTAKISADLARRLKRISGREWVFEGRTSGHRTRQAVYKDVKKAASQLGVEVNATPHSARKTSAVAMYSARGLQGCRKQLQHDSDAVALLYAMADKVRAEKHGELPHMSGEQIEHLARKIAEQMFRVFGTTGSENSDLTKVP